MSKRDEWMRDALECYRAELTPSAGIAQANWSAIEARVAAGEIPLEFSTSHRVSGSGRFRIIAVSGLTSAMVAAAVALLVVYKQTSSWRTAQHAGAAAAYESEPNGPVTGTTVERKNTSAGRSDRVQDNQENLNHATVIEPSRNAPEASARKTPTRRHSHHLETVVSEAALIGQARAALRDRDPTTALELMGGYLRRFPVGQLREEAEVVRLAALCELKRIEEVRVGAHAFMERYSDSPLAGHVRRICADGDLRR